MGAYLAQPEKSKKTLQGESNGLKYCSSEMQGNILLFDKKIGWRRTMQDAVIHETDIGDGNALFAVFDGHGGHQVSKYVQQIFVKTLKSIDDYKEKKYQSAFIKCFKKIDQIILSEDGEKRLRQIKGSINGGNGQKISAETGCTANVVLITKQAYYVSNIGDSRAVLGRKSNCIQLSQDHKPESQIQRSRIQKAGGQIMMGRVNGGLNLSRSFADFQYKQNSNLPYDQQMITCHPDVKKVQRIKQDEFIIMGCDGIWEKYVDNSNGMCTLVKELLVKHQKNYKSVVEDLLEILIAKDTREGVGCDNMSAILIGFC